MYLMYLNDNASVAVHLNWSVTVTLHCCAVAAQNGASMYEQQAMMPIRRECFYRTMLCIRSTSHGPVSIRLSVCPSVRHKSEFY